VVSADVPSAGALVRHGRSGLLCPPDEPSAYVEALAALARDSELRHRLGAEARAASANYSWDAACASAVQAYDRVLERSERSQSQWVARPI